MNRINVPVILACEHTRLVRADSTQARCAQCNTNQVIKDVITSEWHAVCRWCTFSRWCGLSSITANRMANAHALKTGHMLDVTFEDNPASVRMRVKLVKIGVLK